MVTSKTINRTIQFSNDFDVSNVVKNMEQKLDDFGKYRTVLFENAETGNRLDRGRMLKCWIAFFQEKEIDFKVQQNRREIMVWDVNGNDLTILLESYAYSKIGEASDLYEGMFWDNEKFCRV